MAKASNNVTVVLSSDQYELLPAPELLNLTCNSQLDGRVPREVGDTDCTVVAFEAATPQPCSNLNQTMTGRICLPVRATFYLVNGAVDKVSGPSAVGFMIAGTAGDTRLVVSAPITLRRAPRLISATFSSGFGQVELAFDQPTAMPKLPCSALFNAPMPSLGTEPACGWKTSTALVVTLGVGATLVPGEQLILAAQIPDSAGQLISLINQSAFVAAPSQPLLPRVSISGPDAVAYCDTALLTASAALAQGGIFEWGCDGNMAINSLLQNQTMGPTVKIAGALLSPGRKYFISVRMRNRFGALSDAFVRPIALAAAPSVLLSIILPSPPYTRRLGLRLGAYALPSSCSPQESANAAPTFLWRVTAIYSNGTRGPTLLQGEGDELFIAAGALLVGQYAVTLTALLAGQVT